MWKNGTIGKEIVSQSTNDYELKGYVSPTFYNAGNTPVRIMITTLQPGEQIALNFVGLLIETTIPIQFLPGTDPNPHDELHVYWGVIKPC